MQKSDDEWKKELAPEQYEVLRNKATEAPFTGKFLHNKDTGMYTCGACGNELFKTDAQYETTTPGLMGWPSFSDVVDNGAIKLIDDTSLGMRRTEVVCSNCGSHLGHLFDDPESPTNQHYCINSAALNFKPKE